MTGYKSKKDAALDEDGMYLVHQTAQPAQEPWCMKMNGCKTKCEDCPDEAALAQPAQQEPVALRKEYQSGYYDGKKAALAGREWNFCERCGKRTADLTVIHTCTPPQENT